MRAYSSRGAQDERDDLVVEPSEETKVGESSWVNTREESGSETCAERLVGAIHLIVRADIGGG